MAFMNYRVLSTKVPLKRVNQAKMIKFLVRQSFIMTRDEDTDDIIAMVVSKDITEQVRKQREQTQALQDALMQAQHANQAKKI